MADIPMSLCPFELAEDRAENRLPKKAPRKGSFFTNPEVIKSFSRIKQTRQLTMADELKMVFFEKLFYQIDSDSNGYILINEVEKMMSFLSLNTSMSERYEVLRAIDDEGDGLIEQDEFLQACILLLWHVPHSQLQWAANNYSEASTTKFDRNVVYWRKASKQLDRMSRVWIPSAYAIALGWVYSLEMEDNYNPFVPGYTPPVEGEKEMYSGMGIHKSSPLVAVALPARKAARHTFPVEP